SPNAYVAATAAASSRQHHAKPASVAGSSSATNAYNSPPTPMPTSAMASTKPNVKTDPPISGASRRYQTSSIKKNAKPTVPDANSTNGTGALRVLGCLGARVLGCSGTAVLRCSGALVLGGSVSDSPANDRSACRASMATRRFTAAANHSVDLVPRI